MKVSVPKRYYSSPNATRSTIVMSSINLDPTTDSGKLKLALINAKLAHCINWDGGHIYNDVGGFRKKDRTVSRRLKWVYSTLKMTSAEVAKATKAIRKAFKGAIELEVVVVGADRRYTGYIMVWLRQNACEC